MVLGLLFVLLAVPRSSKAQDPGQRDAGQLDTVIGAAQGQLLSEMRGDHWNYPAPWGRHYLSLYRMVLAWTHRDSQRLDPARLRRELLDGQRPDGSWDATVDPTVTGGHLGATVVNYQALRMMGEPETSPALASARRYVRAHGGLESVDPSTAIFLALTGNLRWSRVSRIPLFLFDERLPVNHHSFSIWIGPALMPLAYLRLRRATSDLGPASLMPELSGHAAGIPGPAHPGFTLKIPGLENERRHIDRILAAQFRGGSWGGSVVATMLTLTALEEHARTYPDRRGAVAPAMDRAQAFIEDRMLTEGDGAYQGIVIDGRYWDSAFVLRALRESGVPVATLAPVVSYLMKYQHAKSGGFSHGVEFETIPEYDNTSAVLMGMGDTTAAHPVPVKRALDFLFAEQNQDGGWAAWEKDRTGNFLLRLLTRRMDRVFDLFDESLPCVTGHTIEALARQGHTLATSAPVRRAAAFLEKTQDAATGTWFGRWGVNRLYGTCGAVCGLAAAGYDLSSPRIRRTVRWLNAHQNADGGFGESTRSYSDPAWWGRGPSTATQTGWALMTLVAAGEARYPAAQRAADYLVNAYRAGWQDASVNGTVLPGSTYLMYPSYTRAFPLIALSQYRAAVAAARP